MSDKLTEVIDELVSSKTFNLDAVDSIKKVKDEAKKLEASLEVSRLRNLELDGNVARLQKERDHLTTQVQKLSEELATFRAREAKQRELELIADFAERRRVDLFKVLELVFKSPVYKRQVSETGNAPNGTDQYGNSRSGYTSNELRETVEEE